MLDRRNAVRVVVLALVGSAGLAAQELQPIVAAARVGPGHGGFATPLVAGARFGSALADLGDLDGDGIDDLAAGAPADLGTSTPGSVFILFLAPNGTVAREQAIGQGTGGFTGTLAAGDAFGCSLASLGDLDGDGIPELAVGARRDDTGGTNRGAVWILFLRRDGRVRRHVRIADGTPGFAGQLADGDGFGASVAALGDIDGDGLPDLAAGAHLADGGGTDTGAVWILRLGASGQVLGHQRIGAGTGGFTGALADNDRFGSALASLGDLDGDGLRDLAVGAPLADDAAGQAAGAVFILFLGPGGTVASHRRISDGEAGFTGSVLGSDRFGWGLALVGDLDGDGVADLAVGAPEETSSLQPLKKGRVWLLLLRPDGTVKGHRRIDDELAHAIPGPPFAIGGWSGAGLAALGDHDGDGQPDLAVGAPRHPSLPAAGDQRGLLRVLFLGQQDGETPVFTLDDHGSQTFTQGVARDDRPSEDADNSGLLEPGEDKNGNGHIDTDSGVADVRLEIGAVNLTLGVPPFVPGSGVVPFRVDLIDPTTPGLGTLSARDVAGNVALADVDLYPGLLQTGIGQVIGHVEHDGGNLPFALPDDAAFGAAVTALGDLDGDGVVDLAVGAPAFSGQPAVWILFLRSDGSVKAWVSHLGSPNGRFGTALAVLPDIDGDGVVELAVGEPRAGEGVVWILFLRPDGTAASWYPLTGSTGITGLVSWASFGHSISVLPDLDGNGVPDLAVGTPHLSSVFPVPDGIGRVLIVSVEADGSVAGSTVLAQGGVPEGFVRFGKSVAALPGLGGPGTLALAVGSGVSGAETLLLYDLAPDGTVLSRLPLGGFEQLSTAAVTTDIELGWADGGLAALGDVDGDGVPDLAVGTPIASFDDVRTGAVWLLLMRPDGSVREARPIAQDLGDFTGNLLDPAAGTLGTRFGTSVAVLGDLDGDRCTDLAVGAPYKGLLDGSVWLLRLHTVIDTNPPRCTLTLDPTVPQLLGQAWDARRTEDTDGTEMLEPGEDQNANQRIDQDTGIASIELAPGSVNLVLEVEAFTPGAAVVGFRVRRVDPALPGSGELVVTDMAGNTSRHPVSLL